MHLLSNIKHKFPKLYRLFAKVRFWLGGETIVELPLGFKVYSSRFSYVEKEIQHGRFENRRAEFMRQNLVDQHTFIDIGANIGFYSLLAASLNCNVHCFEPDRQNASRLKQNIKLNAFEQKVHVNSIALGSVRCKLPIYAPLSDNYGRISLVKDDESVASDTVQVDSLDVALPVPDEVVVVKIDVEGFEGQVLSGATQWLTHVKKGSLWIVEVHEGMGVELPRIMSFFSGYSISFFDDSTGRELSSADSKLGDAVLLARK